MRGRIAVSAISLIQRQRFAALWSHKCGNLTPPFSVFSSNFHTDRPKVPTIDFSRVKELDDTIRLFHEMVRMRPQPSVTAYTDGALSLLSVIEAKGINPNVVTYGALINGLCKNGKHDIARDLFNQLPSRGVLPNVWIYNMIIGSLCQEASSDKVKCLLIEMENRGCAPDGVTYNIIIRSLLEKKKLHQAIPFLEEMPKRGFSADSATFSMLIDQVQGQTEDDFLLKLMKNVLPKEILSNT